MKRCRVGDLAFIRSGHGVIPENIGRIVRVVEPSIHSPAFDWLIESEGSPLMATFNDDKTRARSMTAHCIDRVLDPIRPAPESEPAPPVAVPIVETV